jgi:hypothetical protein
MKVLPEIFLEEGDKGRLMEEKYKHIVKPINFQIHLILT